MVGAATSVQTVMWSILGNGKMARGMERYVSMNKAKFMYVLLEYV